MLVEVVEVCSMAESRGGAVPLKEGGKKKKKEA